MKHLNRWLCVLCFLVAACLPAPAPSLEATVPMQVQEDRATPTSDIPTGTPTPTRTPRPTPTPRPLDTAHQGIDPLIEQRARALLAGDKVAFMATVSEEDTEFYAAQETLYAYLQSLPFASFEFIVDRDSGRVDDRRQDWKMEGVEVEWRYSWRGTENQIREQSLTYAFAQKDGVWTLTADELSDDDSWWVLAPLRFEYTDHFLLFYHPDFEDLWEETADLLEGAYDSVGKEATSASGIEPAPIYVIYVASDQDEFGKLAGGGAHTQGRAFSKYALGPEGIRILSRSIYLKGESLRQRMVDDFRTTIKHELVHAMLDTVTMPFTPAWVSEGAAMYLAEQEIDWAFMRQVWEQGRLDWVELEELTPRRSLEADIFDIGKPGIALIRYAYSNALTRYLIDNFGEDTYWELYLSYSRVPWEEVEPEIPGFSSFIGNPWEDFQIRVTDRVVREIFGYSEEELDEQVKAWIDKQLAS